jgi:tRNA dimethylallyltransferase
MNQNSILTIVGPTASGKTAISVEIAKHLGCEIVGLDSRQIYSEIPLGTAQPSIEEQGGIPHHLIGIKSPNKTVAAGAYTSMVMAKVKDIESRGKIPLICGGAGLYYRALVNGIFVESKTDQVVRDRLENEYDKNGSDDMMTQLQEADPEYAKQVHPNNKKRLVRALEIVEVTGKPPSHHFEEQKIVGPPKLNLFTVFLDWDRAVLQDRIAKRTKEMLESGWVNEVKNLLAQYPNERLHPLDSIGYRQIIAHLNNELSELELEDKIVIKTRQFAKRQIQWFRKERLDMTIDMGLNRSIEDITMEILKGMREK